MRSKGAMCLVFFLSVIKGMIVIELGGLGEVNGKTILISSPSSALWLAFVELH